MDIHWALTGEDTIEGHVDGQEFTISDLDGRRLFSFGEWGTSASWFRRSTDAPASCDGTSVMDPVPWLFVMSGSLPPGVVRAVVAQGNEHTEVILLPDPETGRSGWVGFSRQGGELPELLIQFDSTGTEVGRLELGLEAALRQEDRPSDVQPPFEAGFQTELGLWCLEHGVPDPPPSLLPDMVVPIARCIGDRVAAVLSVGLWEELGEEPELHSEAELFVRTPDGWESEGSGGTGWFDPPFDRPELASDDVALAGWQMNGDLASTCGVAGVDIAHVRVRSDRGTSSNAIPIESSFGAFVVAWHRDEGPVMVEWVLESGQVAQSERFDESEL